MADGIPENLEKIEPIVNRVRRNSTGSVGFEMGGYKVLSRYLDVPRSSCHDMCKHGYEHDSPTKAKIPRPSRATLGKILERKKVPGSTKLPSEIKSQTTCQVNGQEMQSSTKRLAPSVNQQSESKLKPLEENASRRHQRRYSDNFIPGNSSKLQESLSNGSSSRQNQSCKMEKDGGSSELSKKKSVVTSTVALSPKSSVKKVSSTISSNNSPRKASQLNSRTSLAPSRTGKISHENVTKKTSHLRESKTKSNTTGISQENSKAKESSLHRDGSKQGKTASSSLCSPSFPPSSGGSNSRTIDTTTQSSVSSSSLMSPSSNSANESAHCDGTSSSTSQNGTTTQKQSTKPRKAGQLGLEKEDYSPKLLKFKKGKTIDTQSEKDSPRKQKLRQVTIKDKGENENGNPIGKGLRKSNADGHSYAAKGEVVTVNLRSNGIEDSKETPSLFNNVIEVTASKLAKTRRSKVKALVGAFETVISLQDKKSSPVIGRS
ncbi:LOW QUALITY PROTEIN: uncharacterized protein LOC107022531 [Solanum pennellii]|uniref:LOW QUALITY PROTEIN: uncharacterized protein LOC107022531 n=1 Tax=Solanum pennellii TaxID=28526 RepID=A0ABM1H0C6_SOLPN|nr:LOW QUALITY PROTEIN: uncharacterized protein LOC107022531 [Solanum pennellii]